MDSKTQSPFIKGSKVPTAQYLLLRVGVDTEAELLLSSLSLQALTRTASFCHEFLEYKQAQQVIA